MILVRVLMLLFLLGSGLLHAAESVDQLRINQIQVIGSHNSYKTAIDRDLYKLMLLAQPKSEGLDYAHPALTDQLQLGLRNLELDVFYDPEGGRYAKPMGLSMVAVAGGKSRPYDPEGKMLQPGFKVLHVQEIDFRSNCPTLRDGLSEIRKWSDKHPRHLPIVVTFNLKTSAIELPVSVKPLQFDKTAMDLLDEEFLEVLGREKIICPDDVRGNRATLEEAVLAGAWPTLAEARGKVLLVMDETGEKRATYLRDHVGLSGRVMFVKSEAGNPEAAVMILNNPVKDGVKIKKLVQQGYLVRTRADAGGAEARRGDFSRFEAAKQSGAQVITTDYYLADWRLNPAYQVRFDDGSCMRLNPLTCSEASAEQQPELEGVLER